MTYFVAKCFANGAAEQGLKLAQGAARTLLAAVAQGVGVLDVDESSPLIPYAVRHGAWLYTKFHVRPSRLTGVRETAWEELRGQPYRGALAEFGEKILYLRPEAERAGKLSQRFATGVFVGREDRTSSAFYTFFCSVVQFPEFCRCSRYFF